MGVIPIAVLAASAQRKKDPTAVKSRVMRFMLASREPKVNIEKRILTKMSQCR